MSVRYARGSIANGKSKLRVGKVAHASYTNLRSMSLLIIL